MSRHHRRQQGKREGCDPIQDAGRLRPDPRSLDPALTLSEKRGPKISSNDLCRLSLFEAADAVREQRVSPVELTEACLDKITTEDQRINSFTAVFLIEALEAALKAEKEIKKGKYRGPLHGIPIAIKDLIDIKGQETTAASRVLQHNVAAEDAAVVKRLRKAGAVILGKNNLHEFAYGGSGYIGCFGPVRNPRDPSRITGGSSSGSAAAVAANFCFAAIGTDTAGSIRLPAACCGIAGLKPRFGLVSTEGVIPLSWSYDHVGPLTRTVQDAGLVLEAICDWNPTPVDVRQLRVGIARRYFWDGINDSVNLAVEGAIHGLAPHVANFRDVEIPVDEDRTVSSSESWLFHKPWAEQKPELYDPRTLARIRSGERYTREEIGARREDLQKQRAAAARLFRDVDVILTPTCPILPPTFDELESDADSLRPLELLMLRNTRPWNVLGIPAITVPCGDMIGLQLAALDENTLLALGSVSATLL
jgi:Asp-tRNA(Asn)/Glu-tRNA(Gln) amidotransferase A subunit family amidase